MQITEFIAGDWVRLLGFGSADLPYRQRLLSLGITRGAEVRIVRIAPLGCPIQVEVRDTSIALRKTEMSALVWERV